VPEYDTWWDVHVAEVSQSNLVAEARKEWEVMRTKERYFL
jgi:3D-(3,5/4)-trihydroxycyclohexane-1,2-dione acylhydrolase (decyclizing)